jgi:hypothetical protein
VGKVVSVQPESVYCRLQPKIIIIMYTKMVKQRIRASQWNANTSMLCVLCAVIVGMGFGMFWMASSSSENSWQNASSSGRSVWFTLPRWGGGSYSSSNDINNIYKPPIQDNLDRFLGPVASDLLGPMRSGDMDRAPNDLARLDLSLGGGNSGGYGLDPERVARTLLPTHVRPPIDSQYKQIGILVSGDENSGTNQILPLMGQYLNNDKWRYYTMLSGNLQTKLPIQLKNKKKCTSEYGCPELGNDDPVIVTGLGKDYKASLYENGTFW